MTTRFINVCVVWFFVLGAVAGFQNPRFFGRVANDVAGGLRMSVKSPRNPGYVEPGFAVKAGVVGTAANVITDYSLTILRQTGCGLPAGFLGLVGAVEGISYLAVVWIFTWSLLTYVRTGGGLPSGPGGLLGLAEGLTYLTVVAGIFVGVANLFTWGFVSSPTDFCPGLQ